MGNELTLKRMQDLLSENDYTEKKYDERDNMDNLSEILNFKGYYFGYHGDSTDVNSTLSKFHDNLSQAKGVYIKFIINENITSNTIGDTIEKLNNKISNDAIVVIDTIIDNNLCDDFFKYQLILTGLSIGFF